MVKFVSDLQHAIHQLSWVFEQDPMKTDKISLKGTYATARDGNLSLRSNTLGYNIPSDRAEDVNDWVLSVYRNLTGAPFMDEDYTIIVKSKRSPGNKRSTVFILFDKGEVELFRFKVFSDID